MQFQSNVLQLAGWSGSGMNKPQSSTVQRQLDDVPQLLHEPSERTSFRVFSLRSWMAGM